jgi:preprotein translocase subunit SecA
LDNASLAAMKASPDDMASMLHDIVEQTLLKTVLNRLVMTIERRLNSRLVVDVDSMVNLDWLSIEDKLVEAVDQVFQERIEQLNQPDSQIRQNITVLLKKQKEAGGAFNLYELTMGISVGTQMVIDQRTRQRVNRRISLLNYVFLAALQIENEDSRDISEAIVAHLEDVQARMQMIWGKTELQRVAENITRYSELPEDYRANMAVFMTEEAQKALDGNDLQTLFNENNAAVIHVFGKTIQQTIYRQILLRAISDLWIEQLTRMEALRISIGMEAYAQRDPLVQYKSQSTDAFKDLFADIRMGVISRMFRLQLVRQQPASPESVTAQKAETASGKEQANQPEKSKKKRHKKH